VADSGLIDGKTVLTHGVLRYAVLDITLNRQDELYEQIQKHQDERRVEKELQIPEQST
jgi:hypothetical protein